MAVQFDERYYTEEEYLDLEEQALEKSEYFCGRIFAMAGATPAHSLISSNTVGELRDKLKGSSCQVHGSDLKVRMPTTLNTYPDALVVCGKPTFQLGERGGLTNPKLIVEVLSASTEPYDTGAKLEHYQTCPTITDVLYISQYEYHARHLERDGNGWKVTIASGLNAEVKIGSLGITLALSEIYLNVELSVRKRRKPWTIINAETQQPYTDSALLAEIDPDDDLEED